MKKAPTLIFSLAFVLAVLSLAGVTVQAQTATPTPTPTPTSTPITTVTVVDEATLTTSPWYDLMVARIDDLFSGIWAWFDEAEAAVEDLQDAANTMAGLLVEGSMEIGDETLTIEDMTGETVDAVAGVFSFRCYLSTPLSQWTLLFLGWMVFVMLVKFAISAIPFLMGLVDFIWGKIIDLWEAIPFL